MPSGAGSPGEDRDDAGWEIHGAWWRWPRGCDAAPCDGAEPTLRLDPVGRALTTARESLRVSWYGTAGRFDEPRTGRAGDDPVTSADNAWTAPATPGAVSLWVVLRDDRGGAAWRALAVTVR